VRLALQLLAERQRDVRLADPRLARQHDHSTFALRGVSPTPQQQLAFLVTPEQLRQLGLVHRLEAARHAARPQHLPNGYRLGPAFERNGAQIAVIEMPARELARLRADQHCPRLRQRLQARGEIGRLADHRLFRRGVIDHELGHDDGASGDADADLEHGFDVGLEIRYGIDQCKSRAHRLFGIILLRAWIAEIGEHAIVHVACDHTVVTADDVGDAGMIRGDHAPHVFWIQSRRKGSRTDQVAKHDRKLTSLGFVPRHRFGRCFGQLKSGPIELGNGTQQLAAMPKRNAEFYQILISEIGEHAGIDVMLGKALRVLGEPE
jgi:hypothetical protein